MAISASQVKELRDKTGAGMMDCKKALIEADGNFQKAIEILRKTGASVAAKRAERTANEGIVLTKIIDDQVGFIVEVNCETDFVAKSDDFVNFTDFVLEAIASKSPANIEELLKLDYDGKNIGEELTGIIGKIGEKIEISRFAIVKSESGILVDYIHHGSKLGVMLLTENVKENNKEELKPLLKDFAMQIAAMKPLYLTRENVPQEAISKELEIYKEIALKEGKPEQIIERIAQGKLNKYYEEVCLMDQSFVKDNSKKIADLVNEFNEKNSSSVKLTKFLRYHLSDEKK